MGRRVAGDRATAGLPLVVVAGGILTISAAAAGVGFAVSHRTAAGDQHVVGSRDTASPAASPAHVGIALPTSTPDGASPPSFGAADKVPVDFLESAGRAWDVARSLEETHLAPGQTVHYTVSGHFSGSYHCLSGSGPHPTAGPSVSLQATPTESLAFRADASGTVMQVVTLAAPPLPACPSSQRAVYYLAAWTDVVITDVDHNVAEDTGGATAEA